jgi:hypothetical protein
VFPRWFAGSWPDSQSGGGTGLGGGGGAGCAGLAAKGAADLTGITDSSLARLLAGSAVSPPMTYAIIFLAATLVAFEVRCTPSPAQMLVPWTVVSSCKLDSSGPKNSNTFRILASAVLLPAAAASDRYFSDPDSSRRKSGSWRLDT